MLLVGLIAIPFFMSGNGGDGEWQAEMPAPDAEEAPTWSPGDTAREWQPPSGSEWPPETATVMAEPTAPGTLSPAGEYVGAPPIAPYGYNAADTTTAMPADQLGTNYGTEMPLNSSMPPFVGQAPVGPSPWDTTAGPATPTPHAETNYQAMVTPRQPTYPATTSRETTQPMPGANYPRNQGPPTPSLATPQPQNVMPGYGAYPDAQPNAYPGNPSTAPGYYQGGNGGALSTTSLPPQYPSLAPNYPVAGQAPAEPYPAQAYPQTASKPAAPISSPRAGAPSPYPSQSLGSPTYPPTGRPPYAPQAAPAAPTGRPYYGAGTPTSPASRASVARLNGTIHEPATRAAYDDRARPSYY